MDSPYFTEGNRLIPGRDHVQRLMPLKLEVSLPEGLN